MGQMESQLNLSHCGVNGFTSTSVYCIEGLGFIKASAQVVDKTRS